MKIIWIKKEEDTVNFIITKVKFKNFFGGYFIRKCYTPKYNNATYFVDTGGTVPSNLWKIFHVFIETKKDYMEM